MGASISTTNPTSARDTAPETIGVQTVAIALAGPAALGACTGLMASPSTTLVLALSLPMVVLGVGLITMPGFYVATALMGFAPRANTMLGTALLACKDLGVVMLGLTPALLLTVSSLPNSEQALIAGTLAMYVASIVGVRAFYHRLVETFEDARIIPLYIGWVLLSAGLGWQFYLMAISSAGDLV